MMSEIEFKFLGNTTGNNKLDRNKLPHLVPVAFLQLSEELDEKVIEGQILKVQKKSSRRHVLMYLAAS